MVDEHAQSQVPGVHPPEQLQDDGGTTEGTQGQPPQVIQQLHGRVPAVMWLQGDQSLLLLSQSLLYCLDHPGCVKVAALLIPRIRLVCLVVVATRAALPQIWVEMMIGSQAKFEIN